MRLIDADALMEQVCLEGDCTQCKTGVNEKVCKWNMFRLKDVIDCLEHAPTIDAVPRWIPCEERLPEKENPYRRRDFYLTTNAYGTVNVTTYEFENDFQKRGWQSDIRILAWMPLPEPYKGERKDNE